MRNMLLLVTLFSLSALMSLSSSGARPGEALTLGPDDGIDHHLCAELEETMMGWCTSSHDYVPYFSASHPWEWRNRPGNQRALECCNDHNFLRAVANSCPWVNQVYYRGNTSRFFGINVGTSFFQACNQTRYVYGAFALRFGQRNEPALMTSVPGPVISASPYGGGSHGGEHWGHQPHTVGRNGRPGVENRNEREWEEFIHRLPPRPVRGR